MLLNNNGRDRKRRVKKSSMQAHVWKQICDANHLLILQREGLNYGYAKNQQAIRQSRSGEYKAVSGTFVGSEKAGVTEAEGDSRQCAG